MTPSPHVSNEMVAVWAREHGMDEFMSHGEAKAAYTAALSTLQAELVAVKQIAENMDGIATVARSAMEKAIESADWWKAEAAKSEAALKAAESSLTQARDNALEEAAKVADAVSLDLHKHSERAKQRGDDATMYRANTAWHRTTEIAEAIRSLKTVSDGRSE